MKYLASSLLLAAVVAAAPAQNTKRDALSERDPVAEVFANNFPTFVGRSEEDVAKFISKGEKVTSETVETAAKWKRDSLDAGDEAAHAITQSKRAIYVRRAAAEDESFWIKENEKADTKAKEAMRLKREADQHSSVANEAHENFISVLRRKDTSEEDVKRAEDEYNNAQFVVEKLKRDADAAAEEASEGYAVVAYALRVRESEDDIENFIKRDSFNAEVAMGQERRVKRELFFANKAARKREALHEKVLKLRADFK